MYHIQAMYSDGSFVTGWQYDSEAESDSAVIDEARKVAADRFFEGDSVRVITGDSELVWDSSEDKAIMREVRAMKSKGETL